MYYIIHQMYNTSSCLPYRDSRLSTPFDVCSLEIPESDAVRGVGALLLGQFWDSALVTLRDIK